MLTTLIIIFIALPLAEITLLIKAGSIWGAGNTIFLVILTGILGAALARAQGLQVLFHIQRDLQQGVMPTDKLVDGFMILAAGLVLLTPGFITDAAGFFVLWPWGRAWLKKIIMNNFRNRQQNAHTVEYYVEE